MNFGFGKSFDNDMYMDDDGLSETYIGRKLNEDCRSAGPATLAKIEQKQESGKTVLVIDTLSPLSKSTVEKVKKMISSSKQKPAGEEASKQEQIEEFLKKYKTFNDVPVKDMRHIIPLLLMEVYVEKHGQYTKKVKGLWEKRPEDWPDTVPFVDPNNRLKNDGVKNVKPKKELLGQMLTYLVDRYTKMKSSAEVTDGYLFHANDPLLLSVVQHDDLFPYELNLVETNDAELREAEQSVSDQSLSTGHSSGYPSLPGYSFVFRQGVKSSPSSLTNDGSMNQSSLSTIEDLLSGAMNEGHGELVEDGPGRYLELQCITQPDLDARPPEQVVDNEEETSSMKDWNPLEEIRERTRLKLGYMRLKGLVSKAVQDQLDNVHGLLNNLLVAGLDDETKLNILKDYYQLEMFIDSEKFRQPLRCSTTLQDLHDKLSLKMVSSMDFMADNTVNSKNMNLSNPAENAQQINSLLNIRPRPGRAGGMVPFPTVNQLEVRCLASEQSAVNDDCRGSMLSDNHKPIQLAQEDGEAQKSEKQEDNLAMDESLPFSITEEDMRELLELFKPELPWPVQESAPVIHSTSQLVGKLEMPVGQLDHVMTSVSVQPWASATPAMMMSAPVFPAQAVRPSQLISNLSVGSPSTAYAEECMNRLSLSVNRDPFPQQLQKASPHEPMQPLLDQLLCKQKAAGRSGGKRCLPTDEDNESDNNITGPSRPAKVPAYNTMIPLVVEEISNNPDKPFPRLLKKKSR